MAIPKQESIAIYTAKHSLGRYAYICKTVCSTVSITSTQLHVLQTYKGSSSLKISSTFLDKNSSMRCHQVYNHHKYVEVKVCLLNCKVESDLPETHTIH